MTAFDQESKQKKQMTAWRNIEYDKWLKLIKRQVDNNELSPGSLENYTFVQTFPVLPYKWWHISQRYSLSVCDTLSSLQPIIEEYILAYPELVPEDTLEEIAHFCSQSLFELNLHPSDMIMYLPHPYNQICVVHVNVKIGGTFKPWLSFTIKIHILSR